MAGWGATSNVRAVARAFTQASKEAEKKCAKKNLNLAANILRKAKQNAPVGESGNLRRSGRIETKGPTTSLYSQIWVVFGGQGTGVDYATYQELGTSFFSGKFYLLRAVREYAPKFLPANREGFEEAWDKAVVRASMSKLI